MSPPRSALQLAALASLWIPLLSGCRAHPPDTSGLVHVTFQTDWYPQPEHGGFYDALAKGYYRDEGLDVTILPGGPFASTGALVASGKIQFSMDSSDHVIQAIANSDEPIVAIGVTMQSDPQGVMVHAESPVKSWADLNGHAVAL